MNRHRNESSSCPICGGHELLPRGQGLRCFGFTTEKTVYCTRMESKSYFDASDAYAHRRDGDCDCGYRHGNPVQGAIFPGFPGMVRAPREDALQERQDRFRTAEEAEAVYVYHDAANAPQMRVLRFSDPKEFRQQHWDGNDWVWGLGERGSRPTPVLYRLAEVRMAIQLRQPVWLVEGEKDADNLAGAIELGAVTTNAGGSSQFQIHHAEQLLGASQINVIRDKDDAGAKWSRSVFQLLEASAGSGVIDIRIYEVPMEHSGADISDYLASGGKLSDLVLVFPSAEQRQKFAIRAPAVSPKALHRIDLHTAEVIPALSWPSDLEGFAFFQGLTILSGQTGSSKSWLALGASLQAALGGMEVLFVSVELDVATVRDRVSRYFMGNLKMLPPTWGLYVPQPNEPWENVMDAVEDRCNGKPLLLVIDSINTLVANEEQPTDKDTYQLGMVSTRMMQCRQMVNRGRGLIGAMLISEANASGEMKGRFSFRANISVNLEKDAQDYRRIDVTVVKNWSGMSGPLGTYELNVDIGRLARVAKEEDDVAF